jgi:hypothetical protein
MGANTTGATSSFDKLRMRLLESLQDGALVLREVRTRPVRGMNYEME